MTSFDVENSIFSNSKISQKQCSYSRSVHTLRLSINTLGHLAQDFLLLAHVFKVRLELGCGDLRLSYIHSSAFQDRETFYDASDFAVADMSFNIPPIPAYDHKRTHLILEFSYNLIKSYFDLRLISVILFRPYKFPSSVHKL